MKSYRFEYGAILKGSQTRAGRIGSPNLFEYGAILKGSQTANKLGVSYGKYKALLSSPQLLKEVIEARGIDVQKCISVLEVRKKLRETEVKI